MTMETLAGKLTISRTNFNRDNPRPIRIRLTDAASGVEIVEIAVSFADFAEALTGMAGMACEFELNRAGLTVLGKRREFKTEVVRFSEVKVYDHADNRSRTRIRETIAAYEVDGWRGRDADADNHHNWLGSDGDGFSAKIGFVRYVDATDKPTEDDPS